MYIRRFQPQSFNNGGAGFINAFLGIYSSLVKLLACPWGIAYCEYLCTLLPILTRLQCPCPWRIGKNKSLNVIGWITGTDEQSETYFTDLPFQESL